MSPDSVQILQEALPMRSAKLAASLLALALLGASVPVSVSARTNDGLNRHMRIDNQTDDTVLEMHVSNVGSSDWGPDQLGDDGMIHAHRYMDWNIDDSSGYCRFDFEFVMANGPNKYAYNINVCRENELDVTDN